MIGNILIRRFGKIPDEIAEEFDNIVKEFANKHELSKEEMAELITHWLDHNIGTKHFFKGELEKIIFALMNYKLGDAVAKLSDRILIANWYDERTLEEVLFKGLNREEYKKLVKEWNESGACDEVNEIVRKYLGGGEGW